MTTAECFAKLFLASEAAKHEKLYERMFDIMLQCSRQTHLCGGYGSARKFYFKDGSTARLTSSALLVDIEND